MFFCWGGSFEITSIFTLSTSSPVPDTLCPSTIPSLTMNQASVRDSFFCWEKAWISPRSRSKRAGEKSANESGSKFIPRFDSSFVEFLQPCFCFSNSKEFINVFMRIGFGFPIKLVSFHESQVVTFDGKFVCGFRNSDYETKSRSNNTVDSPHGFIIHWIVISKIIKEVTEVIDIEDWRIDNSRVLRWIVSLIECNSSVLSTKSSIQNGKCGAQNTLCGELGELMHYFDQTFNSFDFEEKCGAQG
nr:hypothetical protein [Tanacetum cinerariifolium]